MPATPRPSRPAFTPGYGQQSKAHDVDTFPDEAARRLERSRNYPAFTVFAVRPRKALTWLEKDFVGTATRWSLDGAAGSG